MRRGEAVRVLHSMRRSGLHTSQQLDAIRVAIHSIYQVSAAVKQNLIADNLEQMENYHREFHELNKEPH